MKAVFVISTLGAGGAERAMTDLAGFLADQGWSIVLATLERELSLGEGATPAADFYRVHEAVRRVRLGNPQPAVGLIGKLAANRIRVRSLRQLFLTERPQVVLSFMDTTNVLCLLAARGVSVPVVVAERIEPSMHLHTLPRPWRIARRVLYRSAAAVVAQTSAAAGWLRTQCGTPARVIPNALRAMPDVPLAREPFVLSVGRLTPAKGFDVLIPAFAQVAPSFPAWRLVIVGDGAERGRLEAMSCRLGIAERIEWVGRTLEVEALYGRAEVVALASRYEGFPNVLLEAMGMGAAVVATDCRSGPSELIVSGDNGMLVPVDDVEALASVLRDLMSDAARRRRLGSAATAVRERYSFERVLGEWQALLAGVARGGLVLDDRTGKQDPK